MMRSKRVTYKMTLPALLEQKLLEQCPEQSLQEITLQALRDRAEGTTREQLLEAEIERLHATLRALAASSPNTQRLEYAGHLSASLSEPQPPLTADTQSDDRLDW